jgi:hypothetical protein
MAVVKVRRFGEDSRANIEAKINVWVAKQLGAVLVQRTELTSRRARKPKQRPVIVVTIWCEETADQHSNRTK